MEGILALLIPIFALMIPMVAIWTKHQQKLAEMGLETTATASAEKAAQYATQIQRLEDRVQVLERIVTDRGYSLSDEIEALRHDDSSGVPLNTGKKERV